MKRMVAMVATLAVLAGCVSVKESKINPANWFGKDKEERVAAAEQPKPTDPRPLVAEIARLTVDRLPGGAIVHVKGISQAQGYYEGELVPLNGGLPDRGRLTFEFRLMPPNQTTAVGANATREIVVAHFVSTQSLEGVQKIEVIGQNNRRIVNR